MWPMKLGSGLAALETRRLSTSRRVEKHKKNVKDPFDAPSSVLHDIFSTGMILVIVNHPRAVCP